MRSLLWEHLPLCLWLELVVARLSCLRKRKMGHEWRKSPQRNKTGKHLRTKQTGWTAPLSAQIHPVWQTSPPYLLLPMLPRPLRLLPRTTWGPEATALKVKQTNFLHHPGKKVRTITERFLRFWKGHIHHCLICVSTRPDKRKTHSCRPWWRQPKTWVSRKSQRQWASLKNHP